jgi:hypothetical protein
VITNLEEALTEIRHRTRNGAPSRSYGVKMAEKAKVQRPSAITTCMNVRG